VLSGGPEGVGDRLVRIFLSVWDSPAGAAGAALLRSALSNEWSARLFREFVNTQMIRHVMPALGLNPAEAPLRTNLVASQIAGLAMIRYVIKLEPLASAPPEVVVAAVAPTIQRYATGDIGALVSLASETGQRE
jgi:Tetracyclin repressor-like, C-terminal domain